jgi:hypothetical protein
MPVANVRMRRAGFVGGDGGAVSAFSAEKAAQMQMISRILTV